MKTIKIFFVALITLVATSASSQVTKQTFKIIDENTLEKTDSVTADVIMIYDIEDNKLLCYVDFDLTHTYTILSIDDTDITVDYIVKDEEGYLLEMWFYKSVNKVVATIGKTIVEFSGGALGYPLPK